MLTVCVFQELWRSCSGWLQLFLLVSSPITWLCLKELDLIKRSLHESSPLIPQLHDSVINKKQYCVCYNLSFLCIFLGAGWVSSKQNETEKSGTAERKKQNKTEKLLLFTSLPTAKAAGLFYWLSDWFSTHMLPANELWNQSDVFVSFLLTGFSERGGRINVSVTKQLTN